MESEVEKKIKDYEKQLSYAVDYCLIFNLRHGKTLAEYEKIISDHKNLECWEDK